MANFRGRSQYAYSYAGKKVSLHVKVLFGASGAPSIVSGSGMGVSSISRNSAGNYTIALPSAYNALLGVRHNIINATAPASPALYIAADNSASSTLHNVIVQFNLAGTATDPASGEVAIIELILNDSSTGT